MGIYFITIFILFIFSFLEIITTNANVKKAMMIITYLLLVFVVGFRWETGTDWDPYLQIFEDSTSLTDVFGTIFTMEKGYLLFNFIVRSFTDNYSIFLILHAVVFYFLILKSFSKLTHYPQLALLVLFCANMGITGSNRQLLALALTLFGITFLIENKGKVFFSTVFGAFFFHASSFISAIYYFLNRRISAVYLTCAIVISFIIGKTQLPFWLFSTFGGVNAYTVSKTMDYMELSGGAFQDQQLSLAGLLKRILFIGLFMLVRNKISIKMPHYNLLLNGYIVGIVLYFLFSSTLLVMVSRGSLYFQIMEPLILSSVLLIVDNKRLKVIYLILMLILSVSLFFQSISAYPDLFDPYKGIFINSGFMREMH